MKRTHARTDTRTQPDAWLRLVLTSMPIAELEKEIEHATGDERRWLTDELTRKRAARRQGGGR